MGAGAAIGLAGEEGAAAGWGASLALANAEAMAGLTRTSCSFLGPADLRAIRSCSEGLEVCGEGWGRQGGGEALLSLVNP